MTGSWWRWHARVVRAGHADPRVRAARLAVGGGKGAGHRRGARHAGHPVLPAAERADRPARGAGVRPGAGQAAALAAGPAAADTLGAAEGHQGKPGVTLPPPSTPESQAGLDALLADPSHALVAADFDGTLAPIVARPQDARPQPAALPALTPLAAAVGTVAVITGRPAADAVALGGLGALPRLGVVGHHGWEPRA